MLINFVDLINIALRWYLNHRNYVEEIITNEEQSIIPNKEDYNHPELWKGWHWRRFFFEFYKFLENL